MRSVDILLATYNGARYLPEQLASLEAQTHPDWRLILRDDGSEDGSPEIVKDWAARGRHPLLIIEDNDRRVGPAESFARLLARSEAPYFAFCDQDDVWEADKLSRLLEALAGATEAAALAHCDLAVVDHNLSLLAPSFWRQQESDAALRRGAPSDRSRLLFQNPVTGCAMLGTAALRDAMLPVPDAASMHDWWAALTAAYQGQIVPVDQPLIKYRQHGKNSVGARHRTVLLMLRSLLTEPTAGFRRTWKIFDAFEQQAAVAFTRFADVMSQQERGFAKRFSQISDGLWRPGGWWLLFWSFAARRRLSFAVYLVSTTFRRRVNQKENPRP